MSDKQKEVPIAYRDVRIAYEVDEKSVAELAEQYNIDWSDMKKALMDYGITIRKTEKRPDEAPKSYKIILSDKDKVVKDTKPTAVTAE